MSVLNTILKNQAEQQRAFNLENPPPPPVCDDTHLIWWWDWQSPPRLHCGICDPPPAKTREHVRGTVRLRGADGFIAPLTDEEFERLPCGWPTSMGSQDASGRQGCTCNCGSPSCPLGIAERNAASLRPMCGHAGAAAAKVAGVPD